MDRPAVTPRSGGLPAPSRNAPPRGTKCAQKGQGPGRLVNQDREETPLVPEGDGLEKGGHIGHQADLVDDLAFRPGRPPPGFVQHCRSGASRGSSSRVGPPGVRPCRTGDCEPAINRTRRCDSWSYGGPSPRQADAYRDDPETEQEYRNREAPPARPPTIPSGLLVADTGCIRSQSRSVPTSGRVDFPRNWFGDERFPSLIVRAQDQRVGLEASTKTTRRSYLEAHAFAAHWGRDPIVGRADSP